MWGASVLCLRCCRCDFSEPSVASLGCFSDGRDFRFPAGVVLSPSPPPPRRRDVGLEPAAPASRALGCGRGPACVCPAVPGSRTYLAANGKPDSPIWLLLVTEPVSVISTYLSDSCLDLHADSGLGAGERQAHRVCACPGSPTGPKLPCPCVRLGLFLPRGNSKVIVTLGRNVTVPEGHHHFPFPGRSLLGSLVYVRC